ncbi:MAG TPA: hypothetical protein VKU00_03730, partial [Chthonomonadaceae bacterium]|nr:hypothetical protein [Chthonomonadaceae bacterium]
VERWFPGTPFLTTANQPFERMGTKAVELLLDRIEVKRVESYRYVELEAPLSIHGSTRRTL